MIKKLFALTLLAVLFLTNCDSNKTVLVKDLADLNTLKDVTIVNSNGRVVLTDEQVSHFKGVLSNAILEENTAIDAGLVFVSFNLEGKEYHFSANSEGTRIEMTSNFNTKKTDLTKEKEFFIVRLAEGQSLNQYK